MALASGTRVYIAYEEEVSQRGQPEAAPALKMLRTTGRNINLQKNTLRSEEVRSDRQVAALRHGFNQVVGSPGFELSLEAYDDFIQGAMSGTWAVIATAVAQTIDVVATLHIAELTRAAGDWVADGFEVGMVVTTSGLIATNNDQEARITAITSATVMTIIATDGSTIFTNETGDGDETLDATGEVVKIGTSLRTFTIERGFEDVSQYQVFNGCAINQWSVNVQPEQMVNGNFDILGMSAAAMATSTIDDAGGIDPAATNDPMSAFEGSLVEGASESSVVTGVNFTLNNNRSLEGVVGSKFSPDVFEGIATITGEATVFFEDEVLFNKFVNETISAMAIRTDDLNGTDFIVMGFPAIKYTGGDMDPPPQGPVPIVMPWEAQVSSVTGTSMFVQKSNT